MFYGRHGGLSCCCLQIWLSLSWFRIEIGAAKPLSLRRGSDYLPCQSCRERILRAWVDHYVICEDGRSLVVLTSFCAYLRDSGVFQQVLIEGQVHEIWLRCTSKFIFVLIKIWSLSCTFSLQLLLRRQLRGAYNGMRRLSRLGQHWWLNSGLKGFFDSLDERLESVMNAVKGQNYKVFVDLLSNFCFALRTRWAISILFLTLRLLRKISRHRYPCKQTDAFEHRLLESEIIFRLFC